MLGKTRRLFCFYLWMLYAISYLKLDCTKRGKMKEFQVRILQRIFDAEMCRQGCYYSCQFGCSDFRVNHKTIQLKTKII